MSRQRHRLRPPQHPPKRPDGTRQCRGCGGDVPAGRRSWCGDACVERHRIANWQGYARQRVWERDRGRCASCGLADGDFHGPVKNAHLRAGNTMLSCPFLPWEADHIVPLIEGGDGTMENLRTLCRPCHVAETVKLRKRLSEKREGGGDDVSTL